MDLALPGPVKVIGLDLGTSTGWAVFDGHRIVNSGQVELREHSWEGVGMRPFRVAVLVRQLLGEHPGAVVAIELVRRHLGTQAAQLYGALLGAVTSTVEGHGGARYTFVGVADVKLAATGYGRAGKASIVDAAREGFGLAGVGEDEADAVFVAVAAWRREAGGGRLVDDPSPKRSKRGRA
jgi:Holliday junction resolvasome RuvABC endonuclease subunit